MSRLFRGTFWVTVGALISRFFAMLSSIVVVRLLGKEQYGEMGMIYSTVGMFGVFAGFGLGNAATKFISQYRQIDPAKTGRVFRLVTYVSLASAMAIALVLVVCSRWLATYSLHRPDFVNLLRASALLLVVSELAGVQQGVLTGFEGFRKLAKINLLQGVLSPFMTVPLVWGYGVPGAIASYTINMSVSLLFTAVAVRDELAAHSVFPPAISSPGSQASCWCERSILTGFALPNMFSLTLTFPVAWITNNILINTPGGYGELGIFNAANQWRQVVMLVPSLLSSALLPILSQSHGQQENGVFHRLVTLNLRLISVITLPVAIAMMTLGKPLAAIFGRQFDAAAPLIPVVMVSCFLMLISGMLGNVLTGSGKMWMVAAVNLAWAAVLVCCSWLLIPDFGAMGLAGAYLLAYLFQSCAQMAYLERQLAPGAIVSQWRLIVFSSLLLASSLWVTTTGAGGVPCYILLLMLSLVPLVTLVRVRSQKWVPADA